MQKKKNSDAFNETIVEQGNTDFVFRAGKWNKLNTSLSFASIELNNKRVLEKDTEQ